MSRGQRLTFLGIAAIIAVVAVIVLSGGDGETDKAAETTATPTPSGTTEEMAADIKKDLAANETANVSFEASIPGIFEIELEHSGTPLGRLKVEP